jgi:hypothetical protein
MIRGWAAFINGQAREALDARQLTVLRWWFSVEMSAFIGVHLRLATSLPVRPFDRPTVSRFFHYYFASFAVEGRLSVLGCQSLVENRNLCVL